MCNWTQPAQRIHCYLGKLHPLNCNSRTVDRTVTFLNHHGVLAVPIYRAPSYRNNGFDGCKFNAYRCACNLGHFWRDNNVATVWTRINAPGICLFSSGDLRADHRAGINRVRIPVAELPPHTITSTRKVIHCANDQFPPRRFCDFHRVLLLARFPTSAGCMASSSTVEASYARQRLPARNLSRILACMGICCLHQVRRFRMLSNYIETRREHSL